MRSWWREAWRAVCVFVVLSSFATGWSHADFRVADETFELTSGEARSFPMPVHYHRLVGGLDVAGDDPNSVELAVLDPSTWASAGATARLALAEFAVRGGEAQVLNHLVRCCDDATYTPYRLVVRNTGSAPATVDLRAWTVHDDFAVVVDRAESGALGVPFGVFAVLGALALATAVRSRRPDRPDRAGPHNALRWSIGLAVGAGIVAFGLGLAGAVRYDTGLVIGVIAMLADVPVPGGPFGSRAASVMGVLLLAWIGAVGAWIRSVHSGSRKGVAMVGALLGGAHLLGGVLLGLAYDSLAVPVTLGVVMGIPLIAAAWLVGSDTPRRGPMPRSG